MTAIAAVSNGESGSSVRTKLNEIITALNASQEYSTSTWIPTYTGFGAGTEPSSVTARYILIGKLCTVHISATAGTSNATSFTITLPFAAANTAIQSFPAIITDAGAASTGRLNTIVNSNIANVYKTAALGAFTASGLKNIVGVFTYETI